MADIIRAGRGFGSAGAALSLYCQGLNQSAHGTHNNAALIHLHLATGQIGHLGAGPFLLTGQPNAMGGREVVGLANLLSAQRDLASAEHRAEVARLWGVPSVPERPGKTAIELGAALGTGEVKAVWIACTNPSQSLPAQAEVRAALRGTAFGVLQDDEPLLTMHPADLQQRDLHGGELATVRNPRGSPASSFASPLMQGCRAGVPGYRCTGAADTSRLLGAFDFATVGLYSRRQPLVILRAAHRQPFPDSRPREIARLFGRDGGRDHRRPRQQCDSAGLAGKARLRYLLWLPSAGTQPDDRRARVGHAPRQQRLKGRGRAPDSHHRRTKAVVSLCIRLACR